MAPEGWYGERHSRRLEPESWCHGPWEYAIFPLASDENVPSHGTYLQTCAYVEYCKEYGQDPPEDFMDLTGDKDSAIKLERVYGSIDNVEWFVGLFAQNGMLFLDCL